MSTPTDRFAARIRRERAKRGWSLRELGTKASVTPSTLNRVERGGHDVWLNHAAAIADALAIPLTDLIAPSPCDTCDGIPPAGFTCNECGREGAS